MAQSVESEGVEVLRVDTLRWKEEQQASCPLVMGRVRGFFVGRGSSSQSPLCSTVEPSHFQPSLQETVVVSGGVCLVAMMGVADSWPSQNFSS